MTRAMRTKAAIFLAVFYAFVMLAPHAALAIDASKILHCINDINAAAPSDHHASSDEPHSHAAPSAQHEHFGKQSDRDSSNPPVACCGLFSVPALASDPRVDFGITPRVAAVMVISPDLLDGEGPGNINKPPRA